MRAVNLPYTRFQYEVHYFRILENVSCNNKQNFFVNTMWNLILYELSFFFLIILKVHCTSWYNKSSLDN